MEKKTKNKLKEELKQTSDRYRSAVNNDLNQLVDRFKSIAATAIGLGLGFVLLYKLVSYLTHDKSENNYSHSEPKQQDSFFSIMRNLIIKELIVIALGIVQDKVITYLENLKNADEEDSE